MCFRGHVHPHVCAEGTSVCSEEVAKLRYDLQVFNPNIVLLLGPCALRAAGVHHSLSNYRGTLFTSSILGFKCLATYHPRDALRMYEYVPIIRFDLHRLKEESTTKTVIHPYRQLTINLTKEEIIWNLQAIQQKQTPIAMDIEGWVHTGLTCVSIATSAADCFLIPMIGYGGHYWSEEDEVEIWRAFSSMCSNPKVPKILQNSLYDSFVLFWTHRIFITNVRHDTMLKHWELYSELEKSLAFQTSIYTREPYYKNERGGDMSTMFTYCCKDSAVTFEINEVLEKELTGASLRHYQFNVSMLRPLLYMECKGILYDYKKACARVVELEQKLSVLNEEITRVYGQPLNVKSWKQKQDFLYKFLKLPPQVKRSTGKTTTDDEAIIKLYKSSKHPVLKILIESIRIRTRISMLQIQTDTDNRIRCGYNLVGTETGRLSCYTSPTGSGYNLQTIPEYDRDLFLADPEYWFFQCDLSGADGWTVAAWCKFLGDPAMLEDLQFGIKVAKVIALMFLKGPQVSQLPRKELYELTNTIDKTDPIYFGAKCCQHGTNYGMGKNLLSDTIFKTSEGDVTISPREAERLQQLYKIRYPGLEKWHQRIARDLAVRPVLTSASGHQRVFFGRASDHGTLKAAYSSEPQENTTYATNLAVFNLWHSKLNRRPDGRFFVEPLHQVHDAVLGQFKKGDTHYCVKLIQMCFQNPLVIANQEITIPFEGAYGTSWGNLKEGKI